MSARFARARLLLEQGRYELAETEFRQVLAEDPLNPLPHSYLAICLTERKQFKEAVLEGKEAVGGMPDDSFAHYTLAYALYHHDEHADNREVLIPAKQRFKQAEASIGEAIRLDPYNAPFYGLLSSIRLSRRDWQGALDAANQGLEVDPMDVTCTNTRAQALVKLGRDDEAGQTLDTALAEDPEDAFTHANKGWALLHARQPSKALEHFKEALRLDPTMEWAQAGIVEALKARNFIYRWMLAYFLWMSRLSAGVQWGVIIGGYLLVRALGGAARANPQLTPYVLPIQLVYLVFVILTWTAPHLFNLLLRIDRYGRYVLSRDQILGANCVGGCLLLGLLTAGLGFYLKSALVVVAGIGCMGMMIPVGGTFNREGKARLMLGGYTILLALVGLGAFGFALIKSPMAGTLGGLFAIGLFLFGWIANALATR